MEQRLRDANMQLDTLERKHLFESLDKSIYENYKAEIIMEISTINANSSKVNEPISNLDEKIESCVNVTQNVSNYWVNGGIETKTYIQNLVFPQGIVINPRNRQYRTKKVNAIFLKIADLKKVEAKTKKRTSQL